MATSIALQALPSELIGAICRLLPNCDIKSLRLTCRYWRQNSLLRVDRVFISANPRNVEVLFAVANHDIFRHCVKEIMWDDAVLELVSSKEGDGPCGYSSYETDRDADSEEKGRISRHFETEDEKSQWRGFRIVTRVLAQAENCQISELVLDNNKLPTGLNHFVFEEPNEEYDDLCRIVQRPGFRRIVLSLLVGYFFDCDAEDWDFYRNGRISNLLAKAPDLQEVVLQTDYPVDATSWSGKMKDFVSLTNIFPIGKWSDGILTHFRLSEMQVTQDDLICFSSKLSSTLQSIELSFLSGLNG
ncbi:hypothetical protein Forpi1262_v010796 [Fusarium oxysporum f. sp. raphani]|uniref:F-box domain-containing protein n=1 Tax=Fusarium oxysporum f. sp. raphani TaxID=96318 RepID=A0A8J5U4Z9_FUSOX|nr:hypothetical protein Forpi1262_v010796 [Fusarium oxysporum f. sp. raphani]